jgi:hypothetical protein
MRRSFFALLFLVISALPYAEVEVTAANSWTIVKPPKPTL